MSRSPAPASVATDASAGERLTEKAQVALYQIIRESINQAVGRRPEQIGVTIVELEDGGFAVEIDDDGVGYAVASTRGAGTGVSNMAERVAALRGTLTIDSANGRGTQIRGRIPLHP